MRFLLIFLLLINLSELAAQNSSIWQTEYEKSGYKATARYAETIQYCRKLDSASAWLKYTNFGMSPQGRELPLVIMDKNGNFTPDAVRKSGNAVLLIQSGIHAGEIDGKDASLILMREMVITQKLAYLLEHLTVLMIPIFNVDGHERIGPYNRINQNGPQEMGWRTTAQNFNLNRDFMKADAPEMQAWLQLFNQWIPDLLVDCHVTNGADYQYVVTYVLETGPNVSPPLREWSTNFLEPFLKQKMDATGYPIFPYVWLRDRYNLQKGIIGEIFSPRYSNGYGAVQNRIFFLIETHMLKDYQTRVTGTYHVLINLLEIANQEYRELIRINQLSDQQTATRLTGRFLPLRFRISFEDSTMVEFAGFDYHSVKSEISGAEWFRYGDQPVTYSIPFFNKNTCTDSAQVPFAYLIPREWTAQIEKLKLHGVQIQRLSKDTILQVESYHFRNPEWRKTSFEGRHLLTVENEVITEEQFYPAGTFIIRMNQRTNRVIAHLLEPGSSDSFISWGDWNTIFEQKEYAESYVMEKLARQMLRETESLRTEFKEKLKSDSVFAASPWQRLNFFYQRSPYRDAQLNVYPVGKLMQPAKLH